MDGRARCMMASLWKTTGASISRRVGWMEMMLRCSSKAFQSALYCPGHSASSCLHSRQKGSAYLGRHMLLCVWPEYSVCLLSMQQWAYSLSRTFLSILLENLRALLACPGMLQGNMVAVTFMCLHASADLLSESIAESCLPVLGTAQTQSIALAEPQGICALWHCLQKLARLCALCCSEQ